MVEVGVYMILASLFLFALNGIMWMSLKNKVREIHTSEQRIIRLLTRSRLRR